MFFRSHLIYINLYIYIDGIKDREKQLVMTILKQISIFKNNEYVLLRGVWNDVQEDWPCYTEQERQLMKRWVQYTYICIGPALWGEISLVLSGYLR